MRARFVLAPEAALDLVRIWRYLKNNASLEVADRVETAIREKISHLAANPGAGHWRKDFTDDPVKFFLIYAYLIGPRRSRAGCGHSRPDYEPRPVPFLSPHEYVVN